MSVQIDPGTEASDPGWRFNGSQSQTDPRIAIRIPIRRQYSWPAILIPMLGRIVSFHSTRLAIAEWGSGSRASGHLRQCTSDAPLDPILTAVETTNEDRSAGFFFYFFFFFFFFLLVLDLILVPMLNVEIEAVGFGFGLRAGGIDPRALIRADCK